MNKLLALAAVFCLFLSAKPKRQLWVAIGDSITYINEHPKEAGNRVTKGYMTLVTEKLPHIKYVNQGHNGWTSGGIAKSFDQLGVVKADVYSVFLGTNDWWQGRPLGRLTDYQTNTGNNTVYGSFRIIIDKIRALNPQARILLITPMQRVDFVYLFNPKNKADGSYRPKNGQTLESFANAIDSIGRFERLPVVDLYHNRALRHEKLVKFKRLKNPQTGAYENYPYPQFIDVPFTPGVDEYPYPPESVDMTYDGLHPSDKGYAEISRQIVKVIKKW